MKVKKFFKRPEEALVQYRTAEQAALARTHLATAVIFGQNIRVAASRSFDVTLSGADDPLSGDYTNSPLHRYANGRHLKHVCPPTQTLHVANIPVASSLDDLRALFAAHGTQQLLLLGCVTAVICVAVMLATQARWLVCVVCLSPLTHPSQRWL